MIDDFFIKITETFLIIINFGIDLFYSLYKLANNLFINYNKSNLSNKKTISKTYDKNAEYTSLEEFNHSNYFKDNFHHENIGENKDIIKENPLFADFRTYLNKNFKNNSYDSYKRSNLYGEDLNNDYLFENLTYRLSKSQIIFKDKINFNPKKLGFILILLFITLSIFLSMDFAFIIVLFIIMIIYFIIKLPIIRKKNLYSSISSELPFALRHMACELKAGKGLNDTLLSIVKSDYGILSYEYNRVINEVQYGRSLDEALKNMSIRVDSNGLRRVNQQIISTKNLGSNLSESLFIIAEDISLDMRIKLKNYAQKLNGFIMIYTFLVVLAPVVFLIMLIAASTVVGALMPPIALYIIYGLFFPMIIIFMALFIKKLEPKI
ncbi:type II secretion system F family protein [uncultured Methanobrevibacter sp.]|uniref:type II secretion system F family protein n=1 Tax=uncultured Methanobrevibacter sp. TaxID=253161 RepID=UPI0025E1548D|nr:type II secretion system F family protein [uncultured Methanobrevibacter sp.]